MKRPGYPTSGCFPTKTKGVVNRSWLFRFQIDKRERFMASAACASSAPPTPRDKKPPGRRSARGEQTDRRYGNENNVHANSAVSRSDAPK
jgi:hypothetical protein